MVKGDCEDCKKKKTCKVYQFYLKQGIKTKIKKCKDKE